MGNLANTNAFKQFSLFLSKLSFPWVPSVFLVLSSCFVKNAQRCLCFSAFNGAGSVKEVTGGAASKAVSS